MSARVLKTLTALAVFAAFGCSDGSSAPRTGSLAVTVLGAPAGAAAGIAVSGPGEFAAQIPGGGTLQGLAPGSYTVDASELRTEGQIWSPDHARRTVDISSSGIPVAVSVTYTLSSGSLNIEIDGLPDGVGPLVQVRGPSGYFRTVGSATVLTELRPGQYTVSAQSVMAPGGRFSPSDSISTVVVAAGIQPAFARITYSQATAAVEAVISGLPPGTSAPVVLAGPSGMFDVTSSKTISGLLPGPYTLTALNVAGAAQTLVASPGVQGFTLSDGETREVRVNYAPGVAQLNLSVDRISVTQVVQNSTGQVPLVAGRAALLRVFVRSSAINTLRPDVRVRIYRGGSLVATYAAQSTSTAVPTSPNELSLAESWNAVIPAAQVQPGTSVLVDVDPSNSIDDGDRSDNVFPRSGTPQLLDVRTMPRLPLTFVPIMHAGSSTVGNVTPSNASAFLSTTYSLLPVAPGTIDFVVREPYTTSAGTLQSNDGNGAWLTVLSEVLALQRAEGAGRQYYGVVRAGYTSGIAGYGYIRQPVSIGWDHLPSGSGVMAHELGHNWGRLHAPCGSVASSDPAYPHPNGTIGSLGWDAASGTLRLPGSTDLMGYCSNQWISDYTYRGMLDFRLSQGGVAGGVGPTVAAAAANQPGLLVWGRISRGEVILEPAFEVVAPPSLPASPGPYTIRGTDERGVELFSVTFAAEEVADHPTGDRAFAFVVPLAHGDRERLTSIRATVQGRARGAEMRSPGRQAAAAPTARRSAGGRATISWNATEHPLVMVRDPGTRRILAFARGGTASIAAPGREVELVLSDGVRSTVRRIAAE